MEGEKFEAALGGTFKNGQLEDFAVQMHRNISPEFLWELFKGLKKITNHTIFP